MTNDEKFDIIRVSRGTKVPQMYVGSLTVKQWPPKPEDDGFKSLPACLYALIVQWIGQNSSKVFMWVQFLLGVPQTHTAIHKF